MQKVLISSCLLGFPVRYNGKGYSIESQFIQTWLKEGRLISYCPEVAGGLSVPRPAAEIVGGDGQDVIDQKAEVLTRTREDVSDAYLRGTKKAVDAVRMNHIRIAILKSNSPACGFGSIYDGTFSGILRSGDGVTAAALNAEGVMIFNEFQLKEANNYLNQIEMVQ